MEGALTAEMVEKTSLGSDWKQCRSFKQRGQCVRSHSDWGGGQGGGGD